MASLSFLPDLCLLTIYDYLPPLQLLADVPLVCRRWADLQPFALQRRRSLTLNLTEVPDTRMIRSLSYHAGYAPIHHFSIAAEHTCLTFSYPFTTSSPENLILLLKKAFSKIEHLSLMLMTSTSVIATFVLPLFDSWSLQLKSLSLNTAFYTNIVSTDQRDIISVKLYDLLNALNTLPHLKHLKLQIFDYFHYKLSARIDLPIIRQLNSFAFYSLDSAKVIFDSLRNYGHSEALQKITVKQRIFSQAELNIFFQLDPLVKSKFTTLNVSFQSYLQNVEEITPTVLSSISFHFPNLRLLTFPMDRSVSLVSLGRSLADLHHLTDLELSLDFTESKRPSLLSENQLTNAEEIFPLSLLRRLSLSMYFDHSHTDGQSVHFGRLFPKLTHLQIVIGLITACAACRLESFREANKSEKMTCLQRLVEPWKRSNSTLQTINVKYGTEILYQYKSNVVERT